jgi:hypothetical protein
LAQRLRQVNGRAQQAHIFSGRFSLRTVLLLRRTLNKRVSREVLSVFFERVLKVPVSEKWLVGTLASTSAFFACSQASLPFNC